MTTSAEVRSRLLDALRLDLVGPRPGDTAHDAYVEEILPVLIVNGAHVVDVASHDALRPHGCRNYDERNCKQNDRENVPRGTRVLGQHPTLSYLNELEEYNIRC